MKKMPSLILFQTTQRKVIYDNSKKCSQKYLSAMDVAQNSWFSRDRDSYKRLGPLHTKILIVISSFFQVVVSVRLTGWVKL